MHAIHRPPPPMPRWNAPNRCHADDEFMPLAATLGLAPGGNRQLTQLRRSRPKST